MDSRFFLPEFYHAERSQTDDIEISRKSGVDQGDGREKGLQGTHVDGEGIDTTGEVLSRMPRVSLLTFVEALRPQSLRSYLCLQGRPLDLI